MDYQTCLDVAITAALEAGELLRADFNRRGGPSGQGVHSPADNAAEALIRQHLSDAFPDFGQRGEELGDLNKPARDPQQHIWSIDPNDGTSAFIKGWRGAAVSIGLLRAGLPVLGVVYAYAERAGLGDLIAWAEGQPLTRNGQAIAKNRPVLAPTTVLISQNADKFAAISAQLCSPYSYRISPSIAYRLALAAVGEVAAAVSLVGPTVWDVAAGHALLRAVDMDLYQKTGEPVRYDAEGNGVVGDCIGCKPELLTLWTNQDWKAANNRTIAELKSHYPLTKPNPERIISDADLLNRAQGCFVGLLAGDNLGAPVEHLTADEINRANPKGILDLVGGGELDLLPGQPTDDGELALILARSIAKTGDYDVDNAAQAYLYWYDSEPFTIGSTLAGALGGASPAAGDLGAAAACQIAAEAYSHSQSNGALMRIAPLAIWGYHLDLDSLASLAKQDAGLTHQNPMCCDANAVLCVAIALAIRGHDAKTVYQHTLMWADNAAIHHEIRAILTAAASHPPTDYFEHMGWVLIALHNAFYQLLHAPDAQTGIINTVLAGGDTDTNAAITGALLGAVYGAHALPGQWLHALLSARALPESGSQMPRPEAFWPVDVLMLTECLLGSGSA